MDKSINKIILLFYLFIITLPINSAILQGRIFDKETTTPVLKAKIVFDDIFVYTDKNGYFILDAGNRKVLNRKLYVIKEKDTTLTFNITPDIDRNDIEINLEVLTVEDDIKNIELYTKLEKLILEKQKKGKTEGETPEVEKLLETIKELEEKLKDPTLATQKEREKAIEELKKGNTETARKIFEKFDKKEKEQAIEMGENSYYLGNIYLADLEYEKALEQYKEAFHYDPENSLYANETGYLYNFLGDYKNALEYLEKALAIDKKMFGEEHPNVATYLNNIGGAWNSLGFYEKAIGFYQRALDIDKRVYGEKHPKIAISLNNIGSAWDSLGFYEKAIGFYQRALDIDKKVFGEEHPNVATYLNNIGSAFFKLKEYEKALRNLEEAYKICREKLGEEHSYTKSTLQWINIVKTFID